VGGEECETRKEEKDEWRCAERIREEKSVTRVETIGGGGGECSITVALSCCAEEAARRS